MERRHVTHAVLFGLIAVAVGCGGPATPTAPAGPTRQVLAVGETGLEDIRAELPERIEAADAARMLVAIPPDQIAAPHPYQLLAWSPRPSRKPSARPSAQRPSHRPSRRPSTRPSAWHGSSSGSRHGSSGWSSSGYNDQTYILGGTIPYGSFDYGSYLYYPTGSYYYPYAYNTAGYYAPYTYANPSYSYSYSPFLYNTGSSYSPYYYYGVGSMAAQGTTVTAASYAFSPATVTVSKGGTVTFVNQDPATHAVVGEDGVHWTGDLTAGQPGQTVTFPTAGSFTYHCPYHPSMRAQVIVQ